MPPRRQVGRAEEATGRPLRRELEMRHWRAGPKPCCDWGGPRGYLFGLVPRCAIRFHGFSVGPSQAGDRPARRALGISEKGVELVTHGGKIVAKQCRISGFWVWFFRRLYLNGWRPLIFRARCDRLGATNLEN
jgi:hypothetical protein